MNLDIYFPTKNAYARHSRKIDSAIENNLKIKFIKNE
jgi:hypothetical protein